MKHVKKYEAGIAKSIESSREFRNIFDELDRIEIDVENIYYDLENLISDSDILFRDNSGLKYEMKKEIDNKIDIIVNRLSFIKKEIFNYYEKNNDI